MLRKRKWLIVLIGISLLVLLSGCSSNMQASTTADMANSDSWWTRNVVFFFSWLLDKLAFGQQYGLAILLLTIMVRTCMLPLMIKQYRSSKAMQAMQPEIAKIRDKYKDDPKKQQEETMKLYQAHQINPLNGCLPLLIQMPILMALYNAISQNIEIRNHIFLGFRLGVAPANGGWFYYIIPIIAALTTLIQSLIMSNQQPMQGPMKGMIYIFPIMIFFTAINLPVALPFYWIFGNIYIIIQNHFLYKKDKKHEIAHPKIKPKNTNKKRNVKKKGKGKVGR